MIEVRVRPDADEDHFDLYESFDFIVDGVRAGFAFTGEATVVGTSYVNHAVYYAVVTEESKDILSKLLGHYRTDIPPNIIAISWPNKRMDDCTEFLCRIFDKRITISISVSSLDWARGWSVTRYFNALNDFSEEYGFVMKNDFPSLFPDSAFHDHELLEANFDRSTLVLERQFPENSVRDNMGSELETCEADCRALHEAAVNALDTQEGVLALRFAFPEEVRVPCEQYLLYFSQFLKDVGVEATADLTHKAGELLFSVTPADGEEALEKIREALGVYLCLPANPSVDLTPVYNDPIEVQRWMIQIENLKGQLRMANAAMQLQQATIQQQQLTINQQSIYSAAITPDVLVTSIKSEPVTVKESVKLLGEALEITPYEGKGFVVNLPYIVRSVPDALRKVKAIFIKPDEPSLPEPPETGLILHDDRSTGKKVEE